MSKKSFTGIYIFYDQTCPLCQRSVIFSLKRRKDLFPIIFAPIGGDAFQRIPDHCFQDHIPDSIICYSCIDHHISYQGEAIKNLLKHLKFPWSLYGKILSIIPKKLLNFIYSIVAKNRKRIFKKGNKSCQIINKEWQKFFQD